MNTDLIVRALDNACIESFHAILKKEEVYRLKYFDFEIAKIRLFEYIEGWYNRKIIHEIIGFITQEECEKIARDRSKYNYLCLKYLHRFKFI